MCQAVQEYIEEYGLSVRKADWEAARVFPPQQAPPLQLSESQLAQLALFSSHTTQTR